MKNNIYRLLLLLIVCLSNIQSKGQVSQPFIDGLQTGSLKDANIDTNRIATLTNEIAEKYNIHSLLILRNNKLVYENYFLGKDEVFANPAGEVNHTRDSLHWCCHCPT